MPLTGKRAHQSNGNASINNFTAIVEVSHRWWFAKKGRAIWNVKLPDWKTASSVSGLPGEGRRGGLAGRAAPPQGSKPPGDIRAGSRRRTGGATGLLEATGLIRKNFKANSKAPV